MKLGRRVKYSQLLIPNRPVEGRCEQCNAERQFRLLVHCELTQLAWVFQWDFSEQHFRACAECGRAYPMTIREVRQLFPHYQPLPDKARRRLVFAVIWVPLIGYVAYWNLRQYF